MAELFDSYDQVRQAEDVQDIIYNVSPVDNPVCAMSKTLRATGKLHEWSEDELRNARKNAKVEGAAAGDDTSTALFELNNFCQIFDEVARITGTIEEVDKYGRDSEMAYQLEKKYGEMANDEEIAIVGAPSSTGDGSDAARQTAVAGTGTTGGTGGTAREMACVQVQLIAGRNGADLVITSAAGTVAAFEQEILAGHQACYRRGGTPSYMFIPPELALFVADFARGTGRERDFGSTRHIVNVVDLYSSPFGQLEVVLDRFLENTGQASGLATANNIVLGLDMQYLATPVLRATRDYALARDGDADNRQIIRESTVAVLNTDAHFMVDGVSDALT